MSAIFSAGPIGFLIVFGGLLASIMFHEFGHFYTARRFGMKVTKFFVGFGPTLWSTQRGEVEYGIKAVPAGGYVKIIGMVPDEPEAQDEPRAFFRQPAPQRVVVLSAGSFMHMVLAGILLVLIGVISPIPTKVADLRTIGTVVQTCIPTTLNADGSSPACTATDPASPAAGVIQVGDQIESFNGTAVSGWLAFAADVRSHGAGPITVGLKRGGVDMTVPLTLVAVQRAADGGPGTTTVGSIGLGIKQTFSTGTVRQRADLVGGYVSGMVTNIPHVFSKYSTLTHVFSKDRSADGPIGVVGASRIGGQVLGDDQVPLSIRIADILGILASLNFFIGIFNILPLLPLDGGHIALVAVDQTRAGFAKLRGRVAPARVSYTKLIPLTVAVSLLFAVLTVTLLVADIVNPIKIQ